MVFFQQHLQWVKNKILSFFQTWSTGYIEKKIHLLNNNYGSQTLKYTDVKLMIDLLK